MNSVFSNKGTIAVFVLPTLILFCGIVLIPIFVSSYYSLLDWNGVGRGTFIGLDNYVEMFKDTRVLNSIKNSLLFAGASVFIQLPISLVLALILASNIKGEGFYRTVYFIPVLISTVVIAQLWSKIYNADYGCSTCSYKVSAYPAWHKIGWDRRTPRWRHRLFRPCGSTWGIMPPMYAGAKSVSQDVLEAARMDGASRIRTAWSIMIPLMKPILKVSLVFSVIGAFKVFDLIYVLTGGGPFYTTEVPSTLMYATIFDTFRYGYGSAISVFIIVECLVCTILINSLFKTE